MSRKFGNYDLLMIRMAGKPPVTPISCLIHKFYLICDRCDLCDRPLRKFEFAFGAIDAIVLSTVTIIL